MVSVATHVKGDVAFVGVDDDVPAFKIGTTYDEFPSYCVKALPCSHCKPFCKNNTFKMTELLEKELTGKLKRQLPEPSVVELPISSFI